MEIENQNEEKLVHKRKCKERKISPKGYVLIYASYHPNCNVHGYVLEHRLVMERKLGRFLARKEVVHHVNENKQDNCVENLELMKNSEHAYYHGRDKIAAVFSKYGPSANRTEKSYRKQWETRRSKYGETGCTEGKRLCGTSESMKKTWETRRKLYGTAGRKNSVSVSAAAGQRPILKE